MKHGYLILTFIFFFGFNHINAQTYTIKGHVADSLSKAALPGVTVVVISKSNNKIVRGTTSDENGEFSIKNIYLSEVSLRFTMIGYELQMIDSLNSQDVLKTLSIMLKPSTVLLSGVEIKGQRPMIEFHVDKQIINMDKIPGASASSVSNALRNTGIIEVDPSTNKISVRGNNSVNIMIDGHPMPGAELLLSQMPASSVEKVELMTNPSAKEEAEGEAGIINIITKKNKIDNYNGMVGLFISTEGVYIGNVMMNYKKDRFNIYSTIMAGKGRTENSIEDQKTNYNSSSLYQTYSNSNNLMLGKLGLVKFGADYDPDDNNTFSISGNISRIRFDNDNHGNATNFNNRDILIYSYYQTTKGYNIIDTYNYSAYHRIKLNNKGSELSTDAYYFIQNIDIENNLSTAYDYLLFFPKMQDTKNTLNNKTFIIKSDYINPTEDLGTFEAGYRFTLRDRTNDYGNLNFSYNDKKWIDSLNLSNIFKYKENIYALYLTYTNKFYVLEYKAGLRMEVTNAEGKQLRANENFETNYSSYFPSFSLSYKISDRFQAILNIARRINRPIMDYINPFMKINGPNNITKGNPYIEPTYINSYELKLSPILNIFHTNAKGKASPFITTIDDSITMNTIINAASSKTYGVELTIPLLNEAGYPIKLPNWLNMANIMVSYYRLTEEGGYLADKYSIARNAWRINGNANINLVYGINSNLYFNYLPKTTDERGIAYSTMYAGISFSRAIMENKLQISLNISDLFNSTIGKNETFAYNFHSFNRNQHINSRNITLSIQYNFNDFRRKQERKVDDGRDNTEGNRL
ncbi:MAG: TonB-dependent receptor [Bacteroidota bacterium]|nr:TonB-dependent receptor [Bacteroidota bacterium]MDP4194780.1 TonB-dependent receptor [Bacteroidota bacterium]